MIVTLVRKPLEGSVIANSVAYGSAGVNVDGCRVTTPEVLTGGVGNSDHTIGTAQRNELALR